MQFKCDECQKMKDVGDVVRTKPFSAERRVKCYDCYDADDAKDLAAFNRKCDSIISWMKRVAKAKKK